MSDRDQIHCITFHTPACDDHQDRLVNLKGPEGLDDVCPICEIERLQKAYRPADMIEYQELVAEIERLRELVDAEQGLAKGIKERNAYLEQECKRLLDKLREASNE